jgi:thiosulfate dehydrogenase
MIYVFFILATFAILLIGINLIQLMNGLTKVKVINEENKEGFIGSIKSLSYAMIVMFIGLFLIVAIKIPDVRDLLNVFSGRNTSVSKSKDSVLSKNTQYWRAPEESQIPAGREGDLIKYGKELIIHTSKYLGPRGSVAQISNGMNCNNCHLEGGTKPWGNNYSAVFSTYPKFRDRSGAVETIYKRVNDCFERSLNGRPLDSNSKEMRAIYAYIKWLGSNVNKGQKPAGSGLYELAFINRAANPDLGKKIYVAQCKSCHQANGEGMINGEGNEFTYPPLWGKNSYNQGAGLFRLTRFAGYIKSNMPLGATHDAPILTDEQAWDLAAYVNSMPRPQMNLSKDWPNIKTKPIDHPFGPFTDEFSENQHKYGPFGPIKEKRSK